MDSDDDFDAFLTSRQEERPKAAAAPPPVPEAQPSCAFDATFDDAFQVGPTTQTHGATGSCLPQEHTTQKDRTEVGPQLDEFDDFGGFAAPSAEPASAAQVSVDAKVEVASPATADALESVPVDDDFGGFAAPSVEPAAGSTEVSADVKIGVAPVTGEAHSSVPVADDDDFGVFAAPSAELAPANTQAQGSTEVPVSAKVGVASPATAEAPVSDPVQDDDEFGGFAVPSAEPAERSTEELADVKIGVASPGEAPESVPVEDDDFGGFTAPSAEPTTATPPAQGSTEVSVDATVEVASPATADALESVPVDDDFGGFAAPSVEPAAGSTEVPADVKIGVAPVTAEAPASQPVEDDDDDFGGFTSAPPTSMTPSNQEQPRTPAEQPEFNVGVIENVGRFCVTATSPVTVEAPESVAPTLGDESPVPIASPACESEPPTATPLGEIDDVFDGFAAPSVEPVTATASAQGSEIGVTSPVTAEAPESLPMADNNDFGGFATPSAEPTTAQGSTEVPVDAKVEVASPVTAEAPESQPVEDDDDDDFGGFASAPPTSMTPSNQEQPGTPAEQPEFNVGVIENVGRFCVTATSPVTVEAPESVAPTLGDESPVPIASPVCESEPPTATPLGEIDDVFDGFAAPSATATATTPAQGSKFGVASPVTAEAPESVLVEDDDDFGGFATPSAEPATATQGSTEVSATKVAVAAPVTAEAPASQPVEDDDDDDFGGFASAPPTSMTPSNQEQPRTPAEQPEFNVGVIENVGRFCVTATSPVTVEAPESVAPTLASPVPIASPACESEPPTATPLGEIDDVFGGFAAPSAEPATSTTTAQGSAEVPVDAKLGVASPVTAEAPESLPVEDNDDFGGFASAPPTSMTPSNQEQPRTPAEQPEFNVGVIENVGRFCVTATSPVTVEAPESVAPTLASPVPGASPACESEPPTATPLGEIDDVFGGFAAPSATATATTPAQGSEAPADAKLAGASPVIAEAPASQPVEDDDDDDDFGGFTSAPPTSMTPSNQEQPGTPAEQPEFNVGVIENVGRFCVTATSPVTVEAPESVAPTLGDESPVPIASPACESEPPTATPLGEIDDVFGGFAAPSAEPATSTTTAQGSAEVPVDAKIGVTSPVTAEAPESEVDDDFGGFAAACAEPAACNDAGDNEEDDGDDFEEFAGAAAPQEVARCLDASGEGAAQPSFHAEGFGQSFRAEAASPATVETSGSGRCSVEVQPAEDAPNFVKATGLRSVLSGDAAFEYSLVPITREKLERVTSHASVDDTMSLCSTGLPGVEEGPTRALKSTRALTPIDAMESCPPAASSGRGPVFIPAPIPATSTTSDVQPVCSPSKAFQPVSAETAAAASAAAAANAAPASPVDDFADFSCIPAMEPALPVKPSKVASPPGGAGMFEHMFGDTGPTPSAPVRGSSSTDFLFASDEPREAAIPDATGAAAASAGGSVTAAEVAAPYGSLLHTSYVRGLAAAFSSGTVGSIPRPTHADVLSS